MEISEQERTALQKKMDARLECQAYIVGITDWYRMTDRLPHQTERFVARVIGFVEQYEKAAREAEDA